MKSKTAYEPPRAVRLSEGAPTASMDSCASGFGVPSGGCHNGPYGTSQVCLGGFGVGWANLCESGSSVQNN